MRFACGFLSGNNANLGFVMEYARCAVNVGQGHHFRNNAAKPYMAAICIRGHDFSGI